MLPMLGSNNCLFTPEWGDYLELQLRGQYGSSCKIKLLTMNPLKSASGHPIYELLLTGNGLPSKADLHFRQSKYTASNEVRALAFAKKSGLRVPEIVLTDNSVKNAFGVPYIVREHVDGVLLQDRPELLALHWESIVDTLMRLHVPQQEALDAPMISKLLAFQKSFSPLSKVPDFDTTLLDRRFDETLAFLTAHESALAISQSCQVQNGLHPSGILHAADNQICLLNWKNAYSGDFCADLAMLYVTVQDLSSSDANRIAADLIEKYSARYADHTVAIRFTYHVVELYLALLTGAIKPDLRPNMALTCLRRLDAFCAHSPNWPTASTNGKITPTTTSNISLSGDTPIAEVPIDGYNHSTVFSMKSEWGMRNDVRRVFLYARDVEDTGDLGRGGFLHPSEAILLSLLDGVTPLGDIEQRIAYLFDVSPERACAWVHALLARHADALQEGYDHKDAHYSVPRNDPMKFIIPSHQIDLETRRLYKPISMSIHVSDDCMRDCIYCNVHKRKTRDLNNLSLHRWIELFDEAVDLGVICVSLAGGDPFMREDLPEMVKALIDRGIEPSLATKSHVTKTNAERLAEAGLKRMQVSIDAPTPGVADFMTRSPGYFNNAIDSIRNIRSAGITVRCNCVMTRLNARQAPELGALLEDLGVDTVSLTGFAQSIYIPDDLNQALFLDEEDRQFLDVASNRVTKIDVSASTALDSGSKSTYERAKEFASRSQCSAGSWGFIVHSDGKVTLCDEMPVTNDYIVGDLQTQSIMDVWNSPKIDALLLPPREGFRGTVCFSCREFIECHIRYGRCHRDAFKAFGAYCTPTPACPRAPRGLRQT